MKKKSFKNNDYPTEIEAAWYAINRFLSPFDYVVRYTDENDQKQIVTANPNCVLAAKISKIDLFKPIPISKSSFQEHFSRDTILFYKSAPNAKLSTGYGKYDKEALALPFSADLNINSKRITDSKYFVLLVGIDIDCHNNEKHVYEVEALIKKYLPHTYWEDSTNGKGRHGYLKIQFLNSFGVLASISKSLKKLFSQLNQVKNLYGYEAKIDDPAGLPYHLAFKNTNPYQEHWTTLFYKSGKEYKFLGRYINPTSQIWKDYLSYLHCYTTHYFSRKCSTHPAQLEKDLSPEEIQTSFSSFLSQQNISFSPPTKSNTYYEITYQRAFKLPLFGASAAGASPDTPRIHCIKEFHALPYHTSSDLKTAFKLILEDIRNINIKKSFISPNTSGSIYQDLNSVISDVNANSDSNIDPYSFPIPKKGENTASSTHSLRSFVAETQKQTTPTSETSKTTHFSSLKKRTKEYSNNCACTNTQKKAKNSHLDTPDQKKNTNYAEIVDWSELAKIDNKEFDTEEYWTAYQQNRKQGKRKKYEEIITELKQETDTMRKMALFIPAFIHTIGRIPTVAEAESEYINQGLNRNQESSTYNRRSRIQGCLKYYSQKYENRGMGFTLHWKEEKSGILAWLQTRLPYDLTYQQGKRVKSISQEEVGYVYYITRIFT